jgi:hypothetical protein
LTEDHLNDEQARLPGEANIPVLQPPIGSEEQRRKDEKEAEDAHKRRQLDLNVASVEIAKSNRNLTRSLTVFTALAAIAALCQGYIANKSANAARDAVAVASRTLCETQRSNAAQQVANSTTLKTTIDNFHQEQRAWVGTAYFNGFPELNEVLRTKVGIKNTGRTPARNVIAYQVFDPLSIGQKLTFTNEKKATPERMATINPEVVDESMMDQIYGKKVDQPHLDSFSKYDVYVHGKITYLDIFGVSHWTTYCVQMLLTPPKTYKFCDEHNDEGDGKPPA